MERRKLERCSSELTGVKIREDDISVCHRLPQRRRQNDRNKQQRIIVKFVRKDVKDKFYKSRGQLRYQFISQPSLSMAGGVGFYIKNDLFYNIRSDLTISKKEFEALWIEIVNFKVANVICGVIYRHPHGDLDCFMEYTVV
jgi:hypothetical protein